MPPESLDPQVLVSEEDSRYLRPGDLVIDTTVGNAINYPGTLTTATANWPNQLPSQMVTWTGPTPPDLSAPWLNPPPPRKIQPITHKAPTPEEMTRLWAIEAAAKDLLEAWDDPHVAAFKHEMEALRFAVGVTDPETATHAEVLGGRETDG